MISMTKLLIFWTLFKIRMLSRDCQKPYRANVRCLIQWKIWISYSSHLFESALTVAKAAPTLEQILKIRFAAVAHCYAVKCTANTKATWEMLGLWAKVLQVKFLILFFLLKNFAFHYLLEQTPMATIIVITNNAACGHCCKRVIYIQKLTVQQPLIVLTNI